jgi:hypothetical protein
MAELRSPYYLLRNRDGLTVALLRSDGNPEVPMGYQTNPSKFEALTDALVGPGPNALQLPPTIPGGDYTLCEYTNIRRRCVPLTVPD